MNACRLNIVTDRSQAVEFFSWNEPTVGRIQVAACDSSHWKMVREAMSGRNFSVSPLLNLLLLFGVKFFDLKKAIRGVCSNGSHGTTGR
jgi:hypothetical protein